MLKRSRFLPVGQMLDNCLHSGYASVQPAILTSAQRGILPELVLSVAARHGPLDTALGAQRALRANALSSC